MGAYNSNFVLTESEIDQTKNLKPSNSQWIFKHAEVQGMPFSEVQRCWRRFLQMGADKKGALTKTSAIWRTENKVIQQVLRALPWTKKTTLSFHVYLKICHWFSSIDEITKIKVLYVIINKGQPINSIVLERVLRHVYPDKSAQELKSITSSVIEQADYKKLGSIDEEEFVELAKKVPYEDMVATLSFDIIPRELFS